MAKLLIFNDTSRYQHYGCDLVMESLFRNFRARGLRPVSVHRVGTSADKSFDRIVGRHPDATAIVVNGEGVIHHDRKHARGLAALAGRARSAGLGAYLVNAALFENSEALYRDLSCYAGVWVRDGESQATARSHGIDARLAPDLSIDGVAPLCRRDCPRTGWLVTDSVHDEVSASLHALARRADARWSPMRRATALPFEWMRLAGAHRFVRHVQAAEAVLTGRFHAVTLCIATRTPFLALSSNTRKIEALLLDALGAPHRLVRTVAEAEERMRSGEVAFSTEELAAIEDYLARGRVATRQMFDTLTARLQ
jgi:hypothetical protein